MVANFLPLALSHSDFFTSRLKILPSENRAKVLKISQFGNRKSLI